MANAFNRKFRRPTHVGTRAWDASEMGVKVLCAIPLLSGETVERVAIDAFAVTRSEESNFDQPPIFSWVAGFIPFSWGTGGGFNLGPGQLDISAQRLLRQTDTYLGGEPNPSGDSAYAGFDDFGIDARTTFKRSVIGDPIPVGKDSLDNTDARFFDRFRTSIERPFKAESSGIYVFAGVTWQTDAQTEFGVEILDQTQPMLSIHQALTSATSVGTQAGELLWGGDNYIEADSFKESSRRHYAILRPAIRLSERYQS